MAIRNKSKREIIEEEKKKTYMIFSIIIIMICYFSIIFLFGDRGYIRYCELKKRETRLYKDINKLTLKNKIALKKVDRLKKDPHSIEVFARQMGYKKKGELIFKFK